ncbi:MAG: nuclear transport factor 2 family protein, partial [Dietzia sp.]|nr:nuclear transport factor 2 family protein [Dietzia sp.]
MSRLHDGSAVEDLEAIRAVFARRLYVMDTKQWDAYGPCHTEDVVSESWAASGG